jgi:hypothetical protein
MNFQLSSTKNLDGGRKSYSTGIWPEGQTEIVPDRTTGKPVPTKGKCAWEVDYDSHGNWTERRLWFSPADGTPKLLLKKYQRTLTYR